MKTKILHCAWVATIACLSGSAHATNYLKLSGDHIDFYYDADYWTVGASVSGDTITVLPGGTFRHAEVSDGAASPPEGPVSSATVQFAAHYNQGVIAVAHSGYALNNDIATSVNANAQASGSSGDGGYNLSTTFTIGKFGAGNFAAGAELGGTYEGMHFYFDTYVPYTAYPFDVPLFLTSPLNSHSALSASSDFDGTVTVSGRDYTGIGTADLSLSGITYSFGVISAVPEPEQYAMTGAGIALWGALALRRRRPASV